MAGFALACGMIPRAITPKDLSDTEAAALSQFHNAMRAEVMPDDPPIPLEEHLTNWRNPSPHEWFKTFIVTQGDSVTGFATAEWDTTDTRNPHMAWAGVSVLPEYRRRGIGKALLRVLLEACRADGKTRLMTATNGRVPAGRAFVSKLEAKLGLEEHTNQLLLADLDREYLERSLREAPTELFELGWCIGDYPESELEEICRIMEVMNTAPRGEMEFNDFQVTPEQLRVEVEQFKITGLEFRFLYAKERATGRYAGFTQTGFHPNRPHIVNQWGTGVLPEYRGHRLGAWLKAAMIEHLERERPTVDRIRTGNADSNEAMLRINHALGFKPFISRTDWQLEVDATLERL